MKYMLLIHTHPSEFGDRSEAEREAISREYFALNEEAGYVDGAQLQPASAATTVRVDDGRTLTTDGPFAEIKEALGGYYLFEADDLDRAIELAARIPAARYGGGVEIRPLVEY